jgi:hypothetical protein
VAHYSLYVYQLNKIGMVDLVKIMATLLGGYAVFMGLIVILIKVFFPFFTKEELRKQKNRIPHYKVNF